MFSQTSALVWNKW